MSVFVGHRLQFSGYKALASSAPSNRASQPVLFCCFSYFAVMVLCHYGIYVVNNVQNFLCELRQIGVNKVVCTYKTFW